MWWSAAHVVDDVSNRLGQIYTAIETAAKRGKTGNCPIGNRESEESPHGARW